MKRFLIREDTLARLKELKDRLKRHYESFKTAEDGTQGANSRNVGKAWDLSQARADIIIDAAELPALLETEILKAREIPRKKRSRPRK